MLAAEGDIAVVSANFDLGAGGFDPPIRPDPNHHGRLATAMADGFEFDQVVRPGQKLGTAFEKAAEKVGS
jgi:hypothetical protein